MQIKTIEWVGGLNGYLKIIDQSVLPGRLRYLACRNSSSVFQAIKFLNVRGAPAIGIAVAFGLILGIRKIKTTKFTTFYRQLETIRKKLLSARPTAVNLPWALERMKNRALANKHKPIAEIKRLLLSEAKLILKDDRAICQRMGRYGARLIRNGFGVLTYCNAGALATGGSGTALAVLYQAKKDGKRFKVYAPETRPLLQGARLTAWELQKAGINVTLLCDNMVARLMQEERIDCVLVGSDRVVANGDAANKIGTYGLALAAHHHKIPFYVVVPRSSFDLTLKHGGQIPIEYRPAREVSRIAGKYIAPKNTKVYNPAFDITPAKYISAIITEYGIIYPPYLRNIKKVLL